MISFPHWHLSSVLLLHHLHLSSDLGLSKYVNQHSNLNLSRNVRLSVLYDLDFNMPQLAAGSYASSMCVTSLTTYLALPLMEKYPYLP